MVIPGASTSRTRRFLLAAAVVVLGLVAVGTPFKYRPKFDPANEAGRVHAAMAIVDHGSLHLETVWDDVYPDWRKSPILPNGDAAVRDGHYLLDKPPGITLLTVPVIAGLRQANLDPDPPTLLWFLALLLAALPAVLFMAVFSRWLALNLEEARPARLVAPAIVLATPWLLFCSQLVANSCAATLAGLGVFVALGRLGTVESDEGYARGGFFGGLLLGAAVLMESSSGLVALGVVLALLVDAPRRRRVPWLIFGGAGPALIFMVWNTLCFGNPFTTGYSFKAVASMAAAHERGVFGLSWPDPEALFGLLLSPQRGLFFMSPWLILAPVGAIGACFVQSISRAWKVILVLGTVVAPVLLSGFLDWHGGQSLGPRYLLFVFPLFGVAAALAVAGLSRRGVGRFLLPLFAGLLLSSLLLLLVANAGIPSVGEDIRNPVVEVVLPVLRDAGPVGTVWDPLVGPVAGTAIAIAAAIGLMVLTLVGIRRPEGSGGGALGRAVTVLLIVGAAALHLVVVALPRTEEPPGGTLVLHAKWIAFAYMGEEERCEEINREVRRIRKMR